MGGWENVRKVAMLGGPSKLLVHIGLSANADAGGGDGGRYGVGRGGTGQ